MRGMRRDRSRGELARRAADVPGEPCDPRRRDRSRVPHGETLKAALAIAIALVFAVFVILEEER
jgi:hypothetical protein